MGSAPDIGHFPYKVKIGQLFETVRSDPDENLKTLIWNPNLFILFFARLWF